MAADFPLPWSSLAARWIQVLLVGGALWTSVLSQTPAAGFSVRRPDGQPAAGARLHLVQFPRGKTPTEWRGQANDQGVFTLPAEPGESTDGCLTIDHPDCSIAIARTGRWGLHSPDGTRPPAGRVFQLKPQRAFRGRVVDKDQKGIGGAQVVTTLLGARTYVALALHDARSGLLPELGAVSGPDGEFVLRGIEIEDRTLAAGRIGLAAFLQRDGRLWCGEEMTGQQRTSSEPDNDPLLIVVRPVVSVSGQVVDRTSGSAIAGVTVQASGGGPFHLSPTTTDADGRFTIADIPSFARLAVNFDREGFCPVRAFRYQNTRLVNLTNIPNWKIALGRRVRIGGMLIDSTSGEAPLVPVEVGITAEDPQPDGWTAMAASQPVDDSARRRPNGSFDVWIPAGAAKLSVASSSEAGAYQQPYSQTIPITVPTDGKTGWNLTVDRRPGILVQLEATEPQLLKRHGHGGNLLVDVREQGGLGVTQADYTPVWFFPAQAWGRKLEVRMSRRKVIAENQTEDTELQPWTELVADPKTWPIRIKVP